MDSNQIQKLIQDEIERYMANKQFNLSKIPAHSHNNTDSPFVSQINLPRDTPIRLGLGGMISTSNSATVTPGTTSEQIQTSIVAGIDIFGAPLGTSTNNLQINLLHQPQNASNQSFINAFRPPAYGSILGSTISVTSGQSTISIADYNFTTNALAGALININNSAGSLVETQTIASNTTSVVTISGTWANTTSGGTYFIYQPVFFGSADVPWQRLYTCEGTGGGIRFGVGPTAGGQNGMLYMDATGDIYWRNKSGTSTKLN